MPVAIVTGAARGIGAATVHALRRDGWDVIAFDVVADQSPLGYPMATPAELESVAAATGAVSAVGDVRDLADLEAAVTEAVEQFGGLDAAIAAAGVLAPGRPLWQISDDEWQITIDTNLGGVFNLARAAVPAMLARPEPRQGRFVAVSSSAALKATPQLGAYSASKAGVIGLVRGLAADLANTGITSNAIQPGATRTPILDPSAAAYDLPSIEEFAAHHIDNRLLEPAEIAATIAWLCSPDATAINAVILPVDAGMTAR